MKVALMAGHAARSEGAVVCAGYYEGFGEHALARHYLPTMRDCLAALGHEVVLTHREDAGGVSPSFSAKAANAAGVELALEWHFNSASPATKGCEVLYWGPSAKGKAFAERLSQRLSSILGVPNRGAKAITSMSARGFSFFQKTRMPAFIIEPCFAGSNEDDARVFGTAIREGWFQVHAARAIHETVGDVYGNG